MQKKREEYSPQGPAIFKERKKRPSTLEMEICLALLNLLTFRKNSTYMISATNNLWLLMSEILEKNMATQSSILVCRIS